MKFKTLALLLAVIPGAALAEGRCPPGQYPVGDQNAGGCAPIPGAAQSAAPQPTGRWETRWGAIAAGPQANPNAPTSTGVAVSQKSKKLATELALSRCARSGGTKCKVLLAYKNQCAAIADPVASARAAGATRSSINGAETEELASSDAIADCQSQGVKCEIVYSACSMSEYKSF